MINLTKSYYAISLMVSLFAKKFYKTIVYINFYCLFSFIISHIRQNRYLLFLLPIFNCSFYFILFSFIITLSKKNRYLLLLLSIFNCYFHCIFLFIILLLKEK